MDIKSAIRQITTGHNLSGEDMETVMQDIMTGACTQAQIAGFLIGLQMKGETVDEITAAARVMRSLSARVEVNMEFLVDTCGTGGDSSNTFNISTTAAFVTAAAGARVAKHGNRSVSGQCGSSDVLEAAGIKFDLTPDQVAGCINEIGIGFMFAPLHHNAMKYAAGPRKELGVRTIFNLLGPLTNPASAPNQVIGVFDDAWLEIMANVLKLLGSRHVMIVHAENGMDEISISGNTRVAELREGQVNSYSIDPETFDIPSGDINLICVNNIEDSLNMMHSVLNNEGGPAKDIVIMNAGAAIYTSGVADSLADGINRARLAIESGAAKIKLDELVRFTQSIKST